jgi:polyphenol oxidase
LRESLDGLAAVATPSLPEDVRRVREERVDWDVPLYTHPVWERELPWLVQGTTGRGSDGAFDMGLFGDSAVGRTLGRWRALREATGMDRAVHSLQVHGTSILEHGAGEPGMAVSDGFDGHITDRPGVLLTVSVADCVPISLVDAGSRRVALLHGGWRGTARGILRAGLERLGADPADVLCHLGPAICGPCYEVGPEVHDALRLPVPAGPAPVDVRAVQARQAIDAGISRENITVSEHCTRCGDAFFSHRGASRERQVGALGLRP